MVIVRVANVLSVSRPHLPAVVYLALKCRDVFHDFAYLFFPFFFFFFMREMAREKRSAAVVLFYTLTQTHEKRFSRVR